MRTNTKFVLIGAAGLIVAACNGRDKAMSDDLKKDLDLAGSTDGITLATPAAKGSQVVSAIERTTPPAPKRVAQSQRVPRHKPAPTPPAPVEAQKATVSEEVAPQPVAVVPAPADPTPSESPRPHPIDMPSGAGTQVGRGGGSNVGTILGGIISVVLRGGGVDGDECDPRTDGRRRVPTSINSRFPVGINGTFPGSGRIGRGRF